MTAINSMRTKANSALDPMAAMAPIKLTERRKRHRPVR